MKLFAAGFNAWNQLSLGAHPENDEPGDITEFTLVLQGGTIDRPVARLVHTSVRQDGQLITAGIGLRDGDEAEAAYSVVQTANGEILTLRHGADGEAQHILQKFSSISAWRRNQQPIRSYPCDKPVTQMAAFDVGFVTLHQDGSISTMCDPRFQDCLGRDASEHKPADTLDTVPDLSNLGERIKHVAAGGYTLAALTETGGLYVWGRASSGTHRRQQAIPRLNGMPNYVEVDGYKDVRDVALGDSHAIALTTEGSVYVIGENSNGQLGLPDKLGHRTETWTKVDFNIPQGYQVVGVAAGPKASFLLASKIGHET